MKTRFPTPPVVYTLKKSWFSAGSFILTLLITLIPISTNMAFAIFGFTTGVLYFGTKHLDSFSKFSRFILSLITTLFIYYICGFITHAVFGDSNIRFHRLEIAIPFFIITFLSSFVDRSVKKYTFTFRLRTFPSYTTCITYAAPLIFSTYEIFKYLIKGPSSFAFAMSGDARGHVWVANQLISQNGLSIEAMKRFPAYPNYILASITQPFKSVYIYSINGMKESITALGLTMILLLVLISILMVKIYVMLRNSKPLTLTLMLIGNIAFIGSVAGVGLNEGFYGAFFVVMLLLASIYLFLLPISRLTKDIEIKWVFTMQLAITVLTFASWTIMGIIPAFLLLFTLFINFRRIIICLNFRFIMLNILILGSGYPAILILLNTGKGIPLAKLVGSIIAPPPYFCIIVFALIAILLSKSIWEHELVHIGVLLPFFGLGIIVIYLSCIQNPGQRWQYYPSKTAWLGLCALCPVILSFSSSILLDNFYKFGGRISHSSRKVVFHEKKRLDQILTSSTIAFLVFVNMNSMNFYVSNPLIPRALSYPNYQNWIAPNEIGIKTLLSANSYSIDPIVFWKAFDPSDDRLTNFWGALQISDKYPASMPAWNQLSAWAYVGSPMETESFCQFLNSSPRRWSVFTRDKILGEEIAKSCPGELFKIQIQQM